MPLKRRSSRRAPLVSVRRIATSVQKINRPGKLSNQASILRDDAKVFSAESVQPKQPDDSTSTIMVVKTVENLAIMTSSTSVNVNVSKQFTLADVDDYSSYVSCFDQYRITAIEAWVGPSGANLNLANYGKLTSVIDFDDASALTGNQTLDYANAVTSSGQSSHYRHFIPHVAVAVYSGSNVFSTFGNETCPWIDTSGSAAPHYGIKFMITPTSSAATYDAVFRYHVQFRNSR